MPDSSEEKTEKATPKKRSDQRKEGNIFQSKEVIIAFSLIVTFVAFRLLFPLVKSSLTDAIKSYFSLAGTQETLEISDTTQLFISGCIVFAKAALPMLLIAAAAAVTAAIVQTKGLVSFKAIKPKFSRMNPLSGLKNMISLKGMVELLKSILKIILLFYIIYLCIRSELNVLPKMIDMSVNEATSSIGSVLWNIIVKVSIAFAFVAGFDYLYQRWSYEKNLRMTKQEIKEEYKQTEGDPQIKGRIREKQRQMASMRMMQNVPKADVIIRNPTHFAVALGYDSNANRAPVVLAKGADHLALKIVEVGEANGVYIMEDKPLARGLYASVEVDMEIPEEFYQTVAKVLAFVYKLKKKDI